MAKTTIESRQFRIDSMISNFFILLLIPLAALLGFKYFSYQAPPEVSFDVLGDNHMVNEMLKFRNNTAGDHSYKWNFGDSTELVQDRSPMHTYTKHGDYTVTLIVDNQFEFKESIQIDRVKEEKPLVIIPRIVGPSKIYVGEPAIFTCNAEGVSSWAWRVNSGRKVYSTKQSVKLTFSKVGDKIINLVVDGNNEFAVKKKYYVRTRTRKVRSDALGRNTATPIKEEIIPDNPGVYVTLGNIQEENQEEEEVLLSDGELSDMLIDIAKKVGDKKKFLKYFSDNNKNLMVMCNGHLITFEALIKDVEGMNIVIKEFSTETKNSSKIVSVTIRYKKKRRINFDLL